MSRRSKLFNPLGSSNAEGGQLLLVGTPIGNLEDITLRAIRALKESDLVACEDTRRTRKLLDHYGIQTPTLSYHQHNELTCAPELIIRMEGGSKVALVADAGMPGISDPGFRLVHLAVRHKIPVTPIPGPSALVAALATAALPVGQFRFIGFLPGKRLQRRKALEELKGVAQTLVFYESPHRIVEMLRDLREILGERPVSLARELTKIHEEFVRGGVSEILEQLQRRTIKGEFTVVVGGASEKTEQAARRNRSIQREIEQIMSERGLDQRGALKAVARSRGISRSEAYRLLQMEKASPVTSEK